MCVCVCVYVFCNKQYYNSLTFSLLFLDIFSEIFKGFFREREKKRKEKMAGFQITICFQLQIQKQKTGLNSSCTDFCGSYRAGEVGLLFKFTY